MSHEIRDVGQSKLFSKLERIKQRTPKGIEYWKARELQPILGYQYWQNFEEVIKRAMMSAASAGLNAENQFSATTNMVCVGSGAQRQVGDFFLTRYACYLMAMNGDTSKPEIAFAQTYFAVQARRQEIQDQLTAEEKRLVIRERVRNANKHLNGAAKNAGVQRFGLFHDAGYKGLYGGLGKTGVERMKRIPKGEDLLDCIDRAELAANEFRITQTEQKLASERIEGERKAIHAHGDVGREVRSTIRRLGGTMPEKLPAAPSIKRLSAKRQKQIKDGSAG